MKFGTEARAAPRIARDAKAGGRAGRCGPPARARPDRPRLSRGGGGITKRVVLSVIPCYDGGLN